MSTVDPSHQNRPFRDNEPTGDAPHGANDGAPATMPLLAPLAAFEIVIVPGLYGSGPEHWQSRWERFLRQQGIVVRRVAQDDWANPTSQAWSHGLHHTLRACRRPAILVAHSLGAVLVAREGSAHRLGIAAGALLVAPADVEHHAGADAHRVADFAPLPATKLPFPSAVIASRNDEWLSPARAGLLAAQWGATLIDAGRVGHIGSASGVGIWPDGLSAVVRMASSLSGFRGARYAS